MRRRMWSACVSSQHFFSNMVLPGTSSTPPVITRPGSPQACASTAVIMLENRIPKIVTRGEREGQVGRGAGPPACRVETHLDPLAQYWRVVFPSRDHRERLAGSWQIHEIG